MSNKDGKENRSAEEVLEQICQDSQIPERLQLYDPEQGELWFACGDGTNCIYVSCKGKLKKAPIPFKTKLGKEVAERIRSSRLKTIDGKQLFSRIVVLLKAYLHYSDNRVYVFHTVYIIGTYLYTIFSNFGYFFAYSKHPQRGKTRVQEVTSHLAYEATIPLNSPTPASLRDIAVNGGVVQLDTVERWKDKDSYAAVMEFLDAGFRNGGTVEKMVPLPKGDWVRKEYPVYVPYILAGIDKHSLTDTALDRSFPIEMRHKPISVRKKKYHSFQCDEECAPVRDDLYIWALQKAEEVALMDELGFLEEQINKLALNDRAVDIWKPLFTVLFVLGFEEDSKEWADLSSLAVDMHQDKELAELEVQIAILGALQEKAKGDTALVGITTELMGYLQERGIKININDFNGFMEEWGFEQRSIRLGESKKPRRAWEFPVKKLAELKEELIEGLT